MFMAVFMYKVIYLARDYILTTTRVQMTLIDFFFTSQVSISLPFYLYHVGSSMNTASFPPTVLFSFTLEVNGNTYFVFPFLSFH